MIRNVVVGRLNPDADPACARQGLDAIAALPAPGRVACTVGTDLGLRGGNWDIAIVADFEDEASYRAYDQDEEHNRIRRDMFAPICSELVRIQFEV